MDTLIRKIFFYIMKINNFRGDLTDISAKKKVLSESKSPRTGLEQPPPWCRDTDAGAYSLLARAHGTSASVFEIK